MSDFGCKFEQSKTLTPLKVIVKLPAIKYGAGALVKIGLVVIKNRKPANEGVKGKADSDGMIILKTVTTGKTSVIKKMIGFE